MRLLSSIGLAFLLLAAGEAFAQQTGPYSSSANPAPQYPRPYDGFQAGEDAMRYQNDRRILGLNQQLGVVDYYRSWAGVSRYQGYGTWRQDVMVDPWGNPVGGYGGYGSGGYGSPFFYSRPFPATDTVRQSVNQVEIQTGPNRWESHPVYETPPGVPPMLPALPPPPMPSPRAREF